MKSPLLCMKTFRQFSQTLRPSYLNHTTAAATRTYEYGFSATHTAGTHLAYAHTNSRTLPICGLLTLPAPDAGYFGEMFLLYMASPSGN
jgi:hypothetical protein